MEGGILARAQTGTPAQGEARRAPEVEARRERGGGKGGGGRRSGGEAGLRTAVFWEFLRENQLESPSLDFKEPVSKFYKEPFSEI